MSRLPSYCYTRAQRMIFTVALLRWVTIRTGGRPTDDDPIIAVNEVMPISKDDRALQLPLILSSRIWSAQTANIAIGLVCRGKVRYAARFLARRAPWWLSISGRNRTEQCLESCINQLTEWVVCPLVSPYRRHH